MAELTVNKLLKFKGDLTLQAEKIEKEQFAVVPCITEKNSFDYIKFYNKENFISDLPIVQLPINVEKKFRAFTVVSLEMTNHDKGLFPKDIVVGEFVPLNVIKKLNNGELALVLVKDELVLRRLYITKKMIVLRADHKNIEDKEYQFSDIKELWRIRYVFYKRVPEFGDLLEDKLLFLEKELVKLKNSI